MLSKNIRTHILVLKDKREINLTNEQYITIKNGWKLSLRTDPLEIRDIETKELLYDGTFGDIKEFKERSTGNMTGYKKVCDFGTRHDLQEECHCSKKFGCLGIVFQDKLKEIGIEVDYAVDITQEMQNKYLASLQK